MAFLELLFIVVVTHMNIFPCVFGQEHISPGNNASDICDRVRCGNNEFCRVVSLGNGSQHYAQAFCLPCVREGADEVCNIGGFLYSLLSGDASDIWSLMPVECNNGASCPFGSLCAKHPHFIQCGECCFDQVSNETVENTNKKCLLCMPECEDGYACEKVVKWGVEFNECRPVPRPGKCPKFRHDKFCFLKRGPEKCQHDGQCPGKKKCCRTPCGGRDCLSIEEHPPVIFSRQVASRP